MSDTTLFGYVRQMDLNQKICRIRGKNASESMLLFDGKYEAKQKGLEEALKFAMRMSEPVQFVVRNQCLVGAVNIPCPE